MVVKTLKIIKKIFFEHSSILNFFLELLISFSADKIPFFFTSAEINLVSGFIFYLLVLKLQCHEFSYIF